MREIRADCARLVPGTYLISCSTDAIVRISGSITPGISSGERCAGTIAPSEWRRCPVSSSNTPKCVQWSPVDRRPKEEHLGHPARRGAACLRFTDGSQAPRPVLRSENPRLIDSYGFRNEGQVV